MAILTLNEQVARIVSENQRLRAKSHHDDSTIQIITRQYQDLVEMIKRERIEADNEIDGLRTERDQAIQAYRAMEGILVQASDYIVQAVRARDGLPVELEAKARVEHQEDEQPALRPPPVQDEAIQYNQPVLRETQREPQQPTRPPADPQWTGQTADRLPRAQY